MAASSGNGVGRIVQRNSLVGRAVSTVRNKHAMSEERPVRGHPKKQQWWRPDPVTGTWIPEGYEGQIDTVEQREERLRSVPTASLEDRAWWNSLEDLPDRVANSPSPPQETK